MRQTDLLVLLDREAETLTTENWHSAAILMRAAAEEIRVLRRACGMGPDDITDCAALARLDEALRAIAAR